MTRADEVAEFTQPPIHVPEGFVVELAAAAPLVKYPMMACFDERGRLFIAESRGENLEKEELLEKRQRFIRMLEDTDEDGQFDKSTIFADQLVMPEGVVWHRGSVFVLSSPYLWRFEDTDDDGVADVRERLLGYMEFNGKANQHGAYLGPNGRLYFTGGTFGYDLTSKDGKHVVKGNAAGVFSCRADGTDVQVFGTGGINPVEVAFTQAGELLTPCPIFDNLGGRHDALIHWVRGATAGPVDFRPPVLPQTGHRLPAVRRWGQVAPSGLMRYRGTGLGDRYENTFFTTHFNTATVVNTKLERVGATFRGVDEDFMTSTSEDFHPTDVLQDADGSLLVIDTGGWFRISCPFSKVAKPNILGAIYRIRKQGPQATGDLRGLQLPWSEAGSDELAKRLDDSRPVVRDRALDTLATRGAEAVAALQNAIAADSPRQRRNAVWSLSQIGSDQARAAIRDVLDDSDVTVQQAAVRSLGVLKDRKAVPELVELLGASTLSVRCATATALGEIGDPAAVPALLRACAAGGDSHLKHALTYALVEIGDFDQTAKGLASTNSQVQHAALVALDRIAPQRITQKQAVPLLESDDALVKQTALEIIAARPGWTDQIIAFLEDWTVAGRGGSAQASVARGAVASFSTDERVQKLVQRALTSSKTDPQVRATLLEAIGRLRRVPDSWLAPLGELLDSKDEAVRLRTITAIASSSTRKLNDSLSKLGRDRSNAKRIRVEAWICVAGTGAPLSPDAFELLLNHVTAPIPALDQLAAAKAISRAELSQSQLIQVAEALSAVGPLQLPDLVEAFGRAGQHDVELGDRFVAALDHSRGIGALSKPQLESILRKFPESSRQKASELLAKLQIDDQKMAARLKQVSAALVDGDAMRGKQIFFGNRAACSACHTAAGEGGNIGPDLSRIGEIRKRPDLLEAILFPSASIVNNFETYSVIMRDGRVVQGVIQRATVDQIVLRSVQRNEIVVARNEIEQLTRTKTSIMPQGLDNNLSPDQLSDLLAYLQSLRQTAAD
jgi:putative membrane-bound dehydrogenase-like protein